MPRMTANRDSQNWWPQFAILTLLLIFAIVFVVAVLSYNSSNTPTEEQCIAELRRAGANVQFGAASEKYDISFDRPAFDDKQLNEAMPYIRVLEPLVCLSFHNTQITDASVDSLAQCKVGALHIAKTKITAQGAAELHRRLPHTWVHHESLSFP
jgi:hypothetical protein